MGAYLNKDIFRIICLNDLKYRFYFLIYDYWKRDLFWRSIVVDSIINICDRL